MGPVSSDIDPNQSWEEKQLTLILKLSVKKMKLRHIIKLWSSCKGVDTGDLI